MMPGRNVLKSYIDLTRAHFFFVWPLLFCSGLMLAFGNYGGFSWQLTLKAALIGLTGFEAGLVLNDYVDRNRDRLDVEFNGLTRYWRPFGSRPIPSGQIDPGNALMLFLLLATIAASLILTLPYPNSLYVLILMGYSYSAEYFYQVRKRKQRYPVAQLVGRTDLALFPVAGYLCYGSPDSTALLYFIFLYPWAQAHLGVNDLADIANDRARKMNSVTVLYGLKGTAYWILGFTTIHALIAMQFMAKLDTIASYGFILSLALLAVANFIILKGKGPGAGHKALPLFHASLLIYTLSIITDFFLI